MNFSKRPKHSSARTYSDLPYGSIMGVSIAGLFAAGIRPGLLICIVCMIMIAATARRYNLPPGHGRLALRAILPRSARAFSPSCCRPDRP